MAACLSGASTAASLVLNRAAALTYAARPAIIATICSSIRSISVLTSASDPHSSGFLIFDILVVPQYDRSVELPAGQTS